MQTKREKQIQAEQKNSQKIEDEASLILVLCPCFF